MKFFVPICFVLLVVALPGCDQLKDPYKAPTRFSYSVLPQTTSDSIQTSTVHHLAFVDTRITAMGKLFVFLGSTNSSPQNYASLNKSATQLGYHVINLNYLNSVDGQVCSQQADSCFVNYHEEMLFGSKKSDLVAVNKHNSIANRILKLLQRLHKLNSHNGWNQYYEGEELLYSKFVMAGHGQGGGHAAYVAQKLDVDRLVLFSSPNDYSELNGRPAAWLLKDFATDHNQFFALTHRRDTELSIAKQHAIWKSIGVLEKSDTVSADNSQYKTSQALVTNFEPNKNAKTQPLYRNLTAQEYALPADTARVQLKKVWLYILGDFAR